MYSRIGPRIGDPCTTIHMRYRLSYPAVTVTLFPALLLSKVMQTVY